MLQCVYFLIHFSDVAQKMIEKLWHFSEMPYAEAFRYFLASLPCTGFWKIRFLLLYRSTCGAKWKWCGGSLQEQSLRMDPTCCSVLHGWQINTAWEILARWRSLPVPCHCGVHEPAATSLSFCPPCLNGWKEGLLQKEGPSLFSAMILLCIDIRKYSSDMKNLSEFEAILFSLLPLQSKLQMSNLNLLWTMGYLSDKKWPSGSQVCLLHTVMASKGHA